MAILDKARKGISINMAQITKGGGLSNLAPIQILIKITLRVRGVINVIAMKRFARF